MTPRSSTPPDDEHDASRAGAEWAIAFDLPDDRWMECLRDAERPMVLGRIGEYELEEEVQRGGQGVVFRARQPGTKRRIALKRLLAGAFATGSMRRRFEREVEAAALLNHPNIVTVYGMEIVDGTPLLAMEWIDGVPATVWSQGKSPEDVLELFLRIADAIQHAHLRGVVHRDVKPSNVLVDASGQPHVLDFGLAKRCALDGDDATLEASKSAEAFGTPAYASPEQLNASATELDQRTDVYSLGVLLFEMLTDASPYGECGSVSELVRRVGTVRAPRLATFDPRLGAELDTIVRTALEPERDERYATVDAFASDVRRHLAGAPIAATPTSSWTLARRLVARNPLVSGLAAAVFVLALAFAGYAQRQAERFEAQKLVAEEARDAAVERQRRAATLLAYVPDCVHSLNAGVHPLLAKPGAWLDGSVAHSSPNPYFAPASTNPAEATRTDHERAP